MAIVHQTAYDEFASFIASSPTTEEVANFQLSDAVEQRINESLELNGEGRLDGEELAELDDFLRLEHIMRLAKLYAREELST
jgi:hypothetical protein